MFDPVNEACEVSAEYFLDIYSDCMLWCRKHTFYQMIIRTCQVNSSFETFNQGEFIKRIVCAAFRPWFKSNSLFVCFLQEAALHKELHPHESVCVFHTESCGSFHQGRGSVWRRRDRQLPANCEYAAYSALLMAPISLATVFILTRIFNLISVLERLSGT